VVDATADQQLVENRIRRLGLSPRQVELSRLYAYARTQQHDDCASDWDGSPHADTLMRASIVASPAMPSNYTDVGGQTDPIPLRYRRPSVPCNLAKVIISRFTGLLVSEQQAPIWKVEGDRKTEAWVQAITETYGLWAKLIMVRNLGGGMGTGVMGFKIINDEVVFEEADPRWCSPEFDPRNPHELLKLEIKFMYPKDVQDPETFEWKEESYWYRRIIDVKYDVLWKPMPVGDGSAEPDWENKANCESVEHGFGFCPWQWIQNLEVSGDIDGDPDCLGCYDYFDRIGEIDSQCHGGAVRNADPTPVVGTDGNLGSIKMGSKDVLKLEKGGTLAFAETNGSSLKAASDESDRLEKKALRTAECVLPDEDTGDAAATATEIRGRTAAMHNKASLLREQYGNRGVALLMNKIVKVGRKLAAGKVAGEGVVDRNGQPVQPGMIVKGQIKLPPHFDDKGQPIPHELGTTEGAQLKLVWPPFSQPSPQDTLAKVQGVALARTSRVISQSTGVRHLAPDFNVENTSAELAEIKKEPTPGADLAAQSLAELQQGR
jgi:hypothetical protein